MLKETSQKLSGNGRFEGFGIDLIQELSLICGFNYTFHIQADKSSGNPDPKTGKWSGMIGEVLAGVSVFYFYINYNNCFQFKRVDTFTLVYYHLVKNAFIQICILTIVKGVDFLFINT